MPVIVLDRDGVINFDSPDYIKSAVEWQPIPGSIEAVAKLSLAGYQIFVATNQAGIARELFTLDQLDEMHQKMHSLVEAEGGKIDHVFYCPHHPDDRCKCRKPGIGLLVQIADYCGEDLRGQPFVGDSLKDIQAARKMGCEPILVKTGNGIKTLQQVEGQISVFDDLKSFAESVLEGGRRRS